jgi:hypothetical protein
MLVQEHAAHGWTHRRQFTNLAKQGGFERAASNQKCGEIVVAFPSKRVNFGGVVLTRLFFEKLQRAIRLRQG